MKNSKFVKKYNIKNEKSMNANITIDAVEEQIANSKSNNKSNANKKMFNPKDYLDTKLKSGETSRKIKVRILPIAPDDGNFCVEVQTHNLKVDKQIAESGFKSFICLNNAQLPTYNKSVKCPLCNKAFELFKRCKEMRAEGKDEKLIKPLYERACNLANKSTYFVRVIQRGKEEEGVKFWRFNKNSKGEGIFDKLIALYQNKKEAYKEAGKGDYNIFDLNNGRDIIITINRCFDKNGEELQQSCLIDANDFESPLTTDPELSEKWINDEKRWYNAYTARTPDYLEVIAEGEIPYKNEDGKWVAKSTIEKYKQEEKNNKEAVQQEANKVLEETMSKNEPTTKTPNVNVVEEVEDELPF